MRFSTTIVAPFQMGSVGQDRPEFHDEVGACRSRKPCSQSHADRSPRSRLVDRDLCPELSLPAFTHADARARRIPLISMEDTFSVTWLLAWFHSSRDGAKLQNDEAKHPLETTCTSKNTRRRVLLSGSTGRPGATTLLSNKCANSCLTVQSVFSGRGVCSSIPTVCASRDPEMLMLQSNGAGYGFSFT